MIKSSLELALEKAAAIPITKEDLLMDRYHKEGQQLIGKLFKDGIEEFKQQWQNPRDDDHQHHLLVGATKALLANLSLPTQPEQQERIEIVREALLTISPLLLPPLEAITELTSNFKAQYGPFLENLKEQLEAHLERKEQAHFARTGQQKAMTIQSDPEAVTIYADETKKFELHFIEHLHQLKWHIAQQLQLQPEDVGL